MLGEQLAQPRNLARPTYGERSDGNAVAAHDCMKIPLAGVTFEHNLIVRRGLPQSLQANAVDIAPPSGEWHWSRLLAENRVCGSLALVCCELPVIAAGNIPSGVNLGARSQQADLLGEPLADWNYADCDEHLVELHSRAVVEQDGFEPVAVADQLSDAGPELHFNALFALKIYQPLSELWVKRTGQR